MRFHNIERFTAYFMAFFALAGLISCATTDKQDAGENSHVVSVTAISEVFGDGQKVSTIVVEYDAEINTESLSVADFAVEGKTITNIYANTTPEKAKAGVSGKYVIVELSTEIVATQRAPNGEGFSGEGPNGEWPSGEGPFGDGGNRGGPGENGLVAGPNVENPMGQREAGNDDSAPVTNAVITQCGDIFTVKGVVYAADTKPMASTQETHLIVDDFKQLEYADAATGILLKYNLYVPENYEPSKSYPLVLFIHDASGSGKSFTNALTQGLGAVIWASPEEQAKHECFVLAPQYDVVTVDDNFNTTDDLLATVSLVKSLTREYSIDEKRIYTTGQSMGCMSSIVLMVREPDLFAGAMLVAGQWDPDVMGPLAENNLWILVCEGDQKASSGMNAAVAIWEEDGAVISKATWDPLATKTEQTANVDALRAENTNIKYIKFIGGSHTYTWHIAYSIEGVRDWLFSQVKGENKE